MKIAILGYGAEGKSALRFIKKLAEYRKAVIEIRDKKIGKNYLSGLADFDLIIKTPGIPFSLPQVQKALKSGVKITGVTELFFERAKGTIIGITGTKGKGTTSTLLYAILKTAGKDAYLAGNIGTPALEVLPKLNSRSITVLELSSFQLQNLKHSPRVAIILDIFPDHLDAHKNFKEYAEAKSNITRWQNRNDAVFFVADNPITARLGKLGAGKKFPVKKEKGGAYAILGGIPLGIPGEHNRKNAALAASVAKYLGIPSAIIRQTLKKFRGMEHRLEHVATKNNIRFINDSASTNPNTAAAAIRAYNFPIVLIAGGSDKNLNYAPLATALRGSQVRLVVLFGENRKKIANAISKTGIQFRFASNLSAAVKISYSGAKKLIAKNHEATYVLFSPAAASFDMFKNYKDRGRQFKALVKKLR